MSYWSGVYEWTLKELNTKVKLMDVSKNHNLSIKDITK
jgi:hypothetical protein